MAGRVTEDLRPESCTEASGILDILCGACPPGSLALPGAGLRRVELGANCVMVPADGPRENAWIVDTGILRMQYFTECGRRLILGFVLPGEVVGIGRFDANRCSMETVTDCVLYRIDRRAFATAIDERVDLRRAILRQQDVWLERLRTLTWMLRALGPEQRFCAFLVLLVRIMPVHIATDGSLCVTNRLPRRDVADYLGTTSESISRIIHRLHRQRIIEIIDPLNFRIRDMQALLNAGCAEQSLPDVLGLGAPPLDRTPVTSAARPAAVALN